MGLHRKKLFFFLLFLVFFYTFTLWRSTSYFCHDGAYHDPSPSSKRFLATENLNTENLDSIQFKGIENSPRGFWSGLGLAEYHAWHYDKPLAERLVSFFQTENATSILDLGGGAGLYVKDFISQGIFASCYDGNPESQEISEGRCATLDLTKPIQLATYDWVITLRVGRQIPTFLEDQFIANIHNLNRKGVVIYWGDGTPLKTLKKLRNPKNNTEIIQIFQELGYKNDATASSFLQDMNSSDVNYSVQVFRKYSETNFSTDKTNSKISSSQDTKISSVYPEIGKDGGGFINIALTSCGLDKMEEALTLIKSAILFSQHTKLQAVVFVDAETIDLFKNKLKILVQGSREVNPHFQYEVLPATFPPEIEGMASWKEIFKPCSLQRLFLPTILPSVDSIIYFDADSLVLANLTEFWEHFSYMESKAFIGVTEQTASKQKSWFQYNKFPHYGVRGVNTGISLMNLTRMRTQNFIQLITKVRQHYEHLRPSETGDQFLQNLLYNFSPEFVSLIPCEWNLRPIHCRCNKASKCSCRSALENGAGVIHGTKNAFSDGVRLPLFRAIYEAIHTYNFAQDSITSLLERLRIEFQKNLNKSFNGTCFSNSSSSFFKKMESYAANLQLY